MGLKIAFFCGHYSPYGLAHLKPLIHEFDVKVVIIGTEQRWRVFGQKLGGKVYYESWTSNDRYPIRKNLPQMGYQLIA